MDTESIAREIVSIKNRLGQVDDQIEDSGRADIDEERTRLLDRMRHLQDLLATHGSGDHVEQDDPATLDSVYYVPPSW